MYSRNVPTARPDPEAARRQLERVLASPGFLRNERMSQFLRFLAERHLEGHGNQLKESVIAVEVFGRKPDHDPVQDSIVRTEAGRLRGRLAEYYVGEGKDDAIVIELPKGGYTPAFRPRDPTSRPALPKAGATGVDRLVEQFPNIPDVTQTHLGILFKAPPKQPLWMRSNAAWIAAGTFAIVAAVASWIAWRTPRAADHPLTRFSVDLGPEAMAGENTTAAISPDGRRLVFPVRGSDGKQQLATRLLDQAKPALLPGTEAGTDPFFSPDGQWIGFFAGGQLKKISVQGGAPVALTSILATQSGAEGASWGEDGNIVTAMGLFAPLARLPAAGGAAQPLTKLGPNEIAHRWPQVLPGARAVLFTASASISGMDSANIETFSLQTGQIKIIKRGGYFGRYLPSGYLLYMHQGTLFGVRFDADRLEVRGAPSALLNDVAANMATGGGEFDFSATGTFVYSAGRSAAQAWQVGWLDRSGSLKPLLSTPGTYTLPRLSPDGRKLSFVGEGQDVYIYDLNRETTSRLTFTGRANSAVWAPDGKHVVFESIGRDFGLYWIRSDGAGEPQRLLASAGNLVPWSFSSDGRRLAYFERIPRGGDIWTLPLELTDPDHPKPGNPEPFLDTPADELVPSFSPSGRWIAYRSNESGNNEIYVRPFPAGSAGKWQISSGGGLFAFWSTNGRELFFESAENRIMVVDYSVDGDAFVASKPRLWSDQQLFNPGLLNLDLASDGKRFAVLHAPELVGDDKGSVHVAMLLNFFDEVKRRIPAGAQ